MAIIAFEKADFGQDQPFYSHNGHTCGHRSFCSPVKLSTILNLSSDLMDALISLICGTKRLSNVVLGKNGQNQPFQVT